jgi:hypothetical protein
MSDCWSVLMLIKLIQTITIDGDDKVWGFWCYRDKQTAMRSWGAALRRAYTEFLSLYFPTATAQIDLSLVPRSGVRSDLHVAFEGHPDELARLGVGDATAAELAEALRPVLATAWTEWQVGYPEDEEED